MTFDLLRLLHAALFGALAASGFGILFNFGWRSLPWCAASGALALATGTLGQDAGWTVEAASFTAAAAVGCAGRVLRARLGITGTALAVSGCIPMVPGSFAAQAISVYSGSQRRSLTIRAGSRSQPWNSRCV